MTCRHDTWSIIQLGALQLWESCCFVPTMQGRKQHKCVCLSFWIFYMGTHHPADPCNTFNIRVTVCALLDLFFFFLLKKAWVTQNQQSPASARIKETSTGDHGCRQEPAPATSSGGGCQTPGLPKQARGGSRRPRERLESKIQHLAAAENHC